MSPGGHALCPRVGHATCPAAGRAARPRVPSGAGGATCPPKGLARRPCPSLGAPGLLPGAAELLAGDTQRWGDGRWPRSWCPQGLGLSPGRSGGWCFPPTQSTGCQGGDDVAAQPWHPTAPHKPSQKRCRGAGGARCRVPSCDTPGCHTHPPIAPRCSRQCRGSLGGLGDPHPPGAPRSEPPHQPGPGEPPRHSHPGGAGEGARR